MVNANQVSAGAVLGGRYELAAAMASGGMAQVWRARDSVLNRPVAIKILHPHLATDDAFVARFRREAIASARLQHSSIVAVYDTVSESGVEAIVMELIQGRTLRSILDHSPALPPSTVVQIGIQIADALTVAHTAGVVHRDIKPANIMIDNEMRVVVTDFGIAKASKDADLTDTGTLLGTAKYLAPEQVTGDPIDPRTDLYSLGVVMFEATTGEPPFNAETDAATALARIQGAVPRCRDRSSSVPAGLDAIVAKTMAQSPDDRFERAVALKDALVNADLSSIAVDDYLYVGSSPAQGHEREANQTQSSTSAATSPTATVSEVQPPAPRPQQDRPQSPAEGAARQAPPPQGLPLHRPVDQPPPPSPQDGTAVMTPDMIRAETGDMAAIDIGSRPRKTKPAGRRLFGRSLFVLLFVAALAIAGLLAVTGGLNAGDGAANDGPLILTAATSTDPQGNDGEEREDRVARAIDGNSDTAWFTRMYGTTDFADLKEGVGLAVFFDGRQRVGEVAIESHTENWSAEFYLISDNFDTWYDTKRDSFDPGSAQKIGAIADASGNVTVDLENTSGHGVVIWVTRTGTSVGINDGVVRNRMVIREATFR